MFAILINQWQNGQMTLNPEAKEEEPLWEAVLFIFYSPTEGGKFMFEYKGKQDLHVCFPEVGIDKGEKAGLLLIRKIEKMEINFGQIIALSAFDKPNSDGEKVKYYPFLILIQGWEEKDKEQMTPLWAAYETASSLPDLRDVDREALARAQEVIKAKEERKGG